MEKKKKESCERRGRVAALLGGGAEMFFPDTAILRGERGATVYGCRKILHYSPERICLCIGKKHISVIGKSLICTAFCAGSVNVEGQVEGIVYCRKICEGGEKCGRELHSEA